MTDKGIVGSLQLTPQKFFYVITTLCCTSVHPLNRTEIPS